MKDFLRKYHLLLAVFALVIALGGITAVILGCCTKAAMQTEQIETIAEQNAAASPQQPSADALVQLSAETVQQNIVAIQTSRASVLPTFFNADYYAAQAWTQEPYGGDAAPAIAAASAFSSRFFSYTPDTAADACAVVLFSDPAGVRSSFLRIETEDGMLVCCLDADTLTLISISCIVTEGVPLSTEECASKIANALTGSMSGSVISIAADAYLHRSSPIRTYQFQLADGRYVAFAQTDSLLCAVFVYPNSSCVAERVFFEADLRHDPAFVSAAYPVDFSIGDAAAPQDGDISAADAVCILHTFLSAANGRAMGRLDYTPKQITYYIDHSGQRENYYHIESLYATMDIAAKSKAIMALSCENLVNPDMDLTGIPYDEMGGAEYLDYVRAVMTHVWFGQTTACEVSTNAVYDDAFCTVLAEMESGCLYEFFFESGRLYKVEYTYDAALYGRVAPGWAVDNCYVNRLCGEVFLLTDG